MTHPRFDRNSWFPGLVLVSLALTAVASCEGTSTSPAPTHAMQPSGAGGSLTTGGQRGLGGSGSLLTSGGSSAGDLTNTGGVSNGSGGQGQATGGAANAGAPNTRGYYSTNPAEFFGASRCANLNAALCEDFEGTSINANVWSASGTTPVLDPSKAARGAQSVHLHADMNGFSYLRTSAIFPALANKFWGRMFIWIDALPVTPDYAHFTIVEAAGTGDSSKIREGGQYRKFGVGTDGGPTGDWTNINKDPTAETAPEIPEKQWICVEWLYDQTSDETRFFSDGVEHPSLHTFPKVAHGANQNVEFHLPTFNSVWVGWWMYQSNPTPDHFDVWIDEIALDGNRIGCSL